MQAAEKFMFDVSFDNEAEILLEAEIADELPAAEEIVEEIVPTFSEEELELARLQSFEEGKKEGLAATTETLTKQINQTLAQIDQQLERAFLTQDSVNEALSHAALSVAKGVCAKMLPALSERHSFGEVERVIVAVFNKIVEQPRVTISVHSSLSQALEERVLEISAGKAYQGEIVFQSDETMSPSDCKVEWSNGGSERDAKAMWEDISAIVERNIGDDPALWDEPQETPPMAEAAALEGASGAPEAPDESADEPGQTDSQDTSEENLSDNLQQPDIENL